MEKKTCSRCEKPKPLSEFRFANKAGTKYEAECRGCRSKRNHEWYLANIERERAKRRNWQKENLDKHREHVRAYHKRRREGE